MLFTENFTYVLNRRSAIQINEHKIAEKSLVKQFLLRHVLRPCKKSMMELFAENLYYRHLTEPSVTTQRTSTIDSSYYTT